MQTLGIEFLQGKSRGGNTCEEKPSLYADVPLHSVFINCFLELSDDEFLDKVFYREHKCRKRQDESDGYCNNHRNTELVYPDNPLYNCGVYSCLSLLHIPMHCCFHFSVEFPSNVLTEVKHGVYEASGPIPYTIHLEMTGTNGM